MKFQMFRLNRIKFLILILLFLTPIIKANAIVSPTSNFYVNDYANILSEEVEETIEKGFPKLPCIVDSFYSLTNNEKDYAQILLKAAEKGAMFDARVFNIPKEEVTNLIYWRQLDATRNSVQMVGQAYFSHKELQNKSCSDIQDMLILEKGINWNDFPTTQKRGSCCIKNIDLDEYGINRGSGWKIDTNIPQFKGEDREYIERLINFN